MHSVTLALTQSKVSRLTPQIGKGDPPSLARNWGDQQGWGLMTRRQLSLGTSESQEPESLL